MICVTVPKLVPHTFITLREKSFIFLMRTPPPNTFSHPRSLYSNFSCRAYLFLEVITNLNETSSKRRPGSAASRLLTSQNWQPLRGKTKSNGVQTKFVTGLEFCFISCCNECSYGAVLVQILFQGLTTGEQIFAGWPVAQNRGYVREALRKYIRRKLFVLFVFFWWKAFVRYHSSVKFPSACVFSKLPNP